MADAPWVIELASEKMTQQVQLKNPLIVGRADTSGEYKPDVDLGPFGGEEKGVSRRHLKLFTSDTDLMVTDLQSNNGTMLNGQPLEADKSYPLKDKDQLQLGRFKLDVHVLSSPPREDDTQDMLSSQSSTGKGQPLLIVEDEIEVANILALIMSKAGYQTHITHDVIGAIRLFNQKRPVAVILDLMLPDMNGLEFCRYVRRDVERNQTPVVVVSAVKNETNVSQAMDAGADIFLGKPVSAAELQHAVELIVQKRQERAANDMPMLTRHLPGTAPLQAIAPELRHDAAVLFVAGHSELPITLTIKDTVSFGRSTNTPGHQHVDLGRYGAVENGVLARAHFSAPAQRGFLRRRQRQRERHLPQRLSAGPEDAHRHQQCRRNSPGPTAHVHLFPHRQEPAALALYHRVRRLNYRAKTAFDVVSSMAWRYQVPLPHPKELVRY